MHATRRQRIDPMSPRANYGIAHVWVHKQRGSATDHLCVWCAGPAEQWAYDHTDPLVRYDVKTHMAFSVEPERYQPMCCTCHRRFDYGHPVDLWRAQAPPAPPAQEVTDLSYTRSVIDILDSRRSA